MKKILFVEDNQMIRTAYRLLETGLKKRGLQQDIVQDSGSALELIAQKNYDVVVTDGNLYSETDDRDEFYLSGGVEVAKAAKASGAFVIGNSSDPEKFYRLGGDYIDYNHSKQESIHGIYDLLENIV